MVDPKPGWKTTEFWQSIAAMLTGILVTTGILTPESADAWVQAVSAIVGGLVAAISAVGYAISRGLAKKG